MASVQLRKKTLLTLAEFNNEVGIFSQPTKVINSPPGSVPPKD